MTNIDSEIFGDTFTHLAENGPCAGILHGEVVDDFNRLYRAAAEAGFDLAIASGFRSFQRQLAIWNAKARGERPVLDDLGQPMDMNQLDEEQQVFAILRWSALPGASRHHWGTDFDVYDRAALAPDLQPQLLASEYEGNGPFAALSDWLDEKLDNNGFYRPYALDRGGIAPEPWHLSHQRVANQFAKLLSPQKILARLDTEDIALKSVIFDQMDKIFERYIQIP